MNTIKFSIIAKAYDSYLYAGNLFLILTDGRIMYGSYARIIDTLKQRYPQYSNLIELAFRHNEYITSKAGKLFLSIGEVKTALRKLWYKAAKEMEFTLTLDDLNDIMHVMGEWQSIPLDMRMYAMRMFLGCRNGLYESTLRPNDRVINPDQLNRRFDAKVTCVNSKCGSILISAGNDGLFSAELPVNNYIEPTNVAEERVIANKSLRTGWFQYDVLNYESQTTFKYLKNQTVDVDRFARSIDGEHQERKRIRVFGVNELNMQQLLRRVGVAPESISLSFNSSSSGFFMLNDGRFINVNLTENNQADIYFSSRPKEIEIGSSKRKTFGRPLSGTIIPNGCVVEYMNNIILYQNGDIIPLENEAAMRVRSFMSSFRYKDIIAIAKQNEITYHSIDSFDLVFSKNIF